MSISKQELISIFEGELQAWEKLLTGLTPEKITVPHKPGEMSVRDTLTHLAAWQKRIIARFEAALEGHEPRFPRWPLEIDEEDSPELVEQANAWILNTHRDQPWPEVYGEWRTGFLHFLELLRAMPKEELLPGGQLAWMSELEAVDDLPGGYDHHHAEHRGQLEAWLHEDRGANQAD